MKDTQIESPPRTIMEVYKSLPQGTLVELIDNVIYMSPSPVYKHQSVLQTIFRRLSDEIEDKNKGKVIIAPFDVYLDEVSNAVQPDITIVLNGTAGLNESGHFHGVPDVVFEILSSGNKSHDLVKKKALYEKFGVKEYWVIDPETKQAQGFKLESKNYILTSDKIGEINSTLLSVNLPF
jgi:Uma2 family endonuclease